MSSELLSAVRQGRLEIVKQSLSYLRRSNSTKAWPEGYNFLRYATELKHTEIAKVLLLNGSNVNPKNNRRSITPLHYAVINGDIEIVKMLLDRDANVNAKNNQGRTPLFHAVKNKQIEITELLLSANADVNTRDNAGVAPLFEAVENERTEVVQMLLQRGAHVNNRSNNCGKTALHKAIDYGKFECIKLLVNQGADVNATDNDGLAPLYSAVEKGHLQVIKCLLEHGADVNFVCIPTFKRGRKAHPKTRTALHSAVEIKNEKMVKLLLEYGANVDTAVNSSTVLHLAVEKGDLKIVQQILVHKPDINNKSNRDALLTAVLGTDRNIVESLLQYGFAFKPEDVNYAEFLHGAVGKGYLKIVQKFLKDVDTNQLHNLWSKEGYALLHTAAKKKQEEIARLLIHCGADVNLQDIYGKCPIFYAAENRLLNLTQLLIKNGANIKNDPELLNIAVEKESKEIVEIFLQQGADANGTDQYGRTALHFTALGEFKPESSDITKGEMAQLLLSKGADPNVREKNSITVLHAAAEKGFDQVVAALLDYNVDVNMAVNQGITPLHVSAEKGHIKVCQILLESGADIDSRDEYGRTALHMASKRGHNEIIKALLQYGSDINIMDNHDCTALDLAHDTVSTLGLHPYSDDSDDGEYFECSDISIIKTLEHHIVMMETANLFVTEENLELVRYIDGNMDLDNLQLVAHIDEIADFRNACSEEMDRMKCSIGSSNVTFHDILTKSRDQIAIYASNETILEVIKSDFCKTTFPKYYGMINSYFNKGLKRKELLEESSQVFRSICRGFSKLPYNCTDKILNYLGDKDLKYFINVCKSVNILS